MVRAGLDRVTWWVRRTRLTVALALKSFRQQSGVPAGAREIRATPNQSGNARQCSSSSYTEPHANFSVRLRLRFNKTDSCVLSIPSAEFFHSLSCPSSFGIRAQDRPFVRNHWVTSSSPTAPIAIARMLWSTIGHLPGSDIIASKMTPWPGAIG